MSNNIQKYVDIVTGGGVLVYPTETLYAIGCDAFSPSAVTNIGRIKGRPESKPLPLIVGDMDGLKLVTDEISEELLKLAEAFWPGPLSILVRAKAELPVAVKDKDGFTSVRWSPHPVVQEICKIAETALVATSANLSGGEAVAEPDLLHPEIVRLADGVCRKKPYPSGGEPSSVIRLIDSGVEMLRVGAVSEKDILRALR